MSVGIDLRCAASDPRPPPPLHALPHSVACCTAVTGPIERTDPEDNPEPPQDLFFCFVR